METNLAIIVKIVAAIYIIKNVWIFFITQKGGGIWDKVFPMKKKAKPKVRVSAPTTPKKDEYSVVGKSQTVYLKKPVEEEKPAETKNQESSDFIGEEPDIDSEDVEYNVKNEEEPEDLFTPFEESGIPNEFSTGKTFDELFHAVAVIKNPDTDNDDQRAIAAKTLYEVRGTDMYDFITTQISNTAAVEKLLEECLDSDGMPLEKPRRRAMSVEEFEMSDFVD